MPAILKTAAIGLAWFIGYSVAVKLLVTPAAKKYNLPILKDL